MRIMKKFSCIIISLLFFLSFQVRGQDVMVTTAFDTSRILIGDQINFTIVVDQPTKLKLAFPFFKDSLTHNIEVLSGPIFDTVKISEIKIRISEKYLITSFDSGTYKVDPVYVEKNDSAGLKRYYSDYSILEVARVKLTPPDTSAKIFDIVAPYEAPVTLGEILPWILLAPILVTAIWLALKLVRRFKKVKTQTPVPEVIEPAHVIAFRELEKLRNEKLWQSGEMKKYYTRLTEIIRQYLENRYQVCSLELTTSETLEALVKTGFRKNELYNKLKSVLNGADLVKFAKYKPEPVENETIFSDSWDFVNATKVTEAVTEDISVNKLTEEKNK